MESAHHSWLAREICKTFGVSMRAANCWIAAHTKYTAPFDGSGKPYRSCITAMEEQDILAGRVPSNARAMDVFSSLSKTPSASELAEAVFALDDFELLDVPNFGQGTLEETIDAANRHTMSRALR